MFGHCGDNAAAEGFFGKLKRERVHRRRYLLLAEARADVFDYIERCHNPMIQRRLDAKDQAYRLLTQTSVETGQNPSKQTQPSLELAESQPSLPGYPAEVDVSIQFNTTCDLGQSEPSSLKSAQFAR